MNRRFMSEKIAAFAPIPRAKVNIVANAKAGDFRIHRHAYLTSWSRLCTIR